MRTLDVLVLASAAVAFAGCAPAFQYAEPVALSGAATAGEEPNFLVADGAEIGIPPGWWFSPSSTGEEGIDALTARSGLKLVAAISGPGDKVGGNFIRELNMGKPISVDERVAREFSSAANLRKQLGEAGARTRYYTVSSQAHRTMIEGRSAALISSNQGDGSKELTLIAPLSDAFHNVSLLIDGDIFEKSQARLLSILGSYRSRPPKLSARIGGGPWPFSCGDGSWTWIGDWGEKELRGFSVGGAVRKGSVALGVAETTYRRLEELEAHFKPRGYSLSRSGLPLHEVQIADETFDGTASLLVASDGTTLIAGLLTRSSDRRIALTAIFDPKVLKIAPDRSLLEEDEVKRVLRTLFTSAAYAPTVGAPGASR